MVVRAYTHPVDTALDARPSRGLRVAAGALAAGIALALGVLAVLPEGGAWPDRSTTTCPFRLITRLRCPLCGMTRATFHLLHGDLRGALAVHPLAPLVLLLVVGGGLALLARLAVGRPLPPSLKRRWPWLIPAVVAIWTANLIWGTG